MAKIIDFLYEELRIKEEILMYEKSKLGKNEEKSEENKRKAFNIANEPSLTVVKYVLCNETDHVINVTKNPKIHGQLLCMSQICRNAT